MATLDFSPLESARVSGGDVSAVFQALLGLTSSTDDQTKSWTPTYGASGSMTFTGVTTNGANYAVIGDYVVFQLNAIGTTGGTADNVLTATLPITPSASTNKTWLCICRLRDSGGGNNVGGGAGIDSSGILEVFKDDESNFTLGADRRFLVTGIYQKA